MKRFLVVFLLMFLLTGCGERTESRDSQNADMFVYIQKPSLSYTYAVVYQRDTKVMYVVSMGEYNSGNFTMLVNPDGSPMIYEKEKEE